MDKRQRLPEVFESHAHLPWWRRAIIKALETEFGRTVVGVLLIAVTMGPVHYFGFWWFAVCMAWVVGFFNGHSFARWEHSETGEVSKL